ncbi:MAG TPA: hemolysin III family protein [Bacilli bacterium]|nr:hemolysin III family protein [Bacilli bacterium]
MGMKLKDLKLPHYSLREELISSISHGAGALLSIVGLILCLIKVIPMNDPWRLGAVLVYGISLIILFTMSCLYHSLARNKGKKVLRIMDHNMIFLLVAGSYTPFTLVALRPINVFGWGTSTVAFLIFAFVWIFCIIGTIFNSINLKKYGWLSMTCYIVAGWCIMVAFVPLWDALGQTGFYLILSSGIAYTLGAVIYGIGRKIQYAHSVFHFFILIGAILMFFSIYLFVL